MSYEIEYDRIVFVKNAEWEWDRVYYAFWLHGSSNVYEACSNRRARNWGLYAVGNARTVMLVVCRNAGYTEYGDLTLRGRFVKPETYIRKWREAIKNARPISELNRMPLTRLRLYVHEDEKVAQLDLDEYDQAKWEKLKTGWEDGRNYYNARYFEKPLTVEALDEYASMEGARFLRAVEVC